MSWALKVLIQNLVLSKGVEEIQIQSQPEKLEEPLTCLCHLNHGCSTAGYCLFLVVAGFP